MENKIFKILIFKPHISINDIHKELIKSFDVGKAKIGDEFIAIKYKDEERIPKELLDKLKKMGHVSMEWADTSRVKRLFS